MFNTFDKKTLLIPIIAIALFIGILVGYQFFKNPLDNLEYTNYIVELGDKVHPDAEMFGLSSKVSVDISNLSKKKTINVSKNGYITTKGKKYLDTGEYPFYLKYSGEKKKVYVTVKDTIKPQFTKTTKKITISDGSQNIDLNKHFKAKDKSGKVVLSAYTNGVDLSKAGTYSIKVYATDKSGNRASKECELVIQNDNSSINASGDQSQTKESGQESFVNAFRDETSANRMGKKILSEGGCTAYKVIDSGFGTYKLLFRNPTDPYK